MKLSSGAHPCMTNTRELEEMSELREEPGERMPQDPAEIQGEGAERTER